MLASLINRNFLIQGENISAFKFVSRLKDNSILIIALFLLFTLYRGFTITKILPKVYSDEFPQTYFEMVNKAESGKETSVNGKYKYQEFKEKYDQFIEQSK
jgi:capsular polysaccharide biosynthesis protein